MTRYEQLCTELSETPRTWLVTGVAGFIGSHLLEHLLGLGQRVVGLDNFSTGRRENLVEVERLVGPGFRDRFELVEGDIRDLHLCRRLCADAPLVLHQAALGSVPRSIDRPADTHASNVDGTINMMIAAVEGKVPGFAYASSSSVYGDSAKLPKVEDEIGNPLSPYAASKRICEIYGKTWHQVYGLPTVGLRYFNVVGPRQDPNGAYAAVVPRWLAALSRGEPAVINGDGETSRDFCPVANVVQVNILAALAPVVAHGRAYNVALGQQTSLNELFAILRDGLADRGFPCGGAAPRFAEFRKGDVRHSLADTTRAREDLGYVPTLALQAGLASAIDAIERS